MAAGQPPSPLEPFLEAVVRFDGEALTRLLQADCTRLGVMGFITRLAAPLMREIGDRWRAGTLQVHHEHFLSERLGDVLRSLRMPLDGVAAGPTVIFATLPGESHGLGLQMAALVAATSGCRVVYLGTDVPTADIATLARNVGARAVALSISAASDPADTARHALALRQQVPPGVTLVAGGEGARHLQGDVVTFDGFETLRRWCAHVAS
jgi:methanogenic corrinoid protein MtbC1